jgi:hypothetical protein
MLRRSLAASSEIQSENAAQSPQSTDAICKLEGFLKRKMENGMSSKTRIKSTTSAERHLDSGLSPSLFIFVSAWVYSLL